MWGRMTRKRNIKSGNQGSGSKKRRVSNTDASPGGEKVTRSGTPKVGVSERKGTTLSSGRTFMKRLRSYAKAGARKLRNVLKVRKRAKIDIFEKKHTSSSSRRHTSNEVYVERAPRIPYLLFYKNKIPFRPTGDFIDNIHLNWRDDFEKVYTHQELIDWLFPIMELEEPPACLPLTKGQRTAMNRDKTVRERILRSYEMMLNFYGFELVDPITGELKRSSNYSEKFNRLDSEEVAWEWITRMLKSLGEFRYGHLKDPFLKLFSKEMWLKNNFPHCKAIYDEKWLPLHNRKEKVFEGTSFSC